MKEQGSQQPGKKWGCRPHRALARLIAGLEYERSGTGEAKLVEKTYKDIDAEARVCTHLYTALRTRF